MYADQDSIKDFERRHARDVIAEAARHVGEKPPSGIVSGHFEAAEPEGLWLSLVGVAAIAAGVALVVLI